MRNRNICTKCGASLMSSWSYCPICGQKIVEETEEEKELLNSYFNQEFPSEPETDTDSFSTDKMRRDLELTNDIHEPEPTETKSHFFVEEEEEEDSPTEELPTIANYEPVQEEDFDDDDIVDEEEASTGDLLRNKWPLLLLIVLLLAAIILAFMIFIKPSLSSGRQKEPEPTAEVEETPESTPEIEETPEPEPTPEPVEEKTLTIGSQEINVRSEPSTSGRIVRVARSGETYTYTDSKEAGGYTWYCIGENEWVATNGSWLTLNN